MSKKVNEAYRRAAGPLTGPSLSCSRSCRGLAGSRGLVWKELALQTTTGSWFKRVTLALHALLVVR